MMLLLGVEDFFVRGWSNYKSGEKVRIMAAKEMFMDCVASNVWSPSTSSGTVLQYTLL